MMQLLAGAVLCLPLAEVPDTIIQCSQRAECRHRHEMSPLAHRPQPTSTHLKHVCRLVQGRCFAAADN